jgi:hypothetical protein
MFVLAIVEDKLKVAPEHFDRDPTEVQSFTEQSLLFKTYRLWVSYASFVEFNRSNRYEICQ